ncbi:MAG: hypothetical protein OEZ47_14135 [Gammaproteobacteria bacterium]|nr:hypothetical protein [Gammaproteobacteria bacterium]
MRIFAKSKLLNLGLAVFVFLLSGCGTDQDGIIGTGETVLLYDIELKGAVQKGPYVVGSEILINKILPNGYTSRETIVSEISDYLGNFEFLINTTGPVLLSADGYHFNEITGKLSNGTLRLKGVYHISEDPEQRAYVNILTHLAYKRVFYLIRELNMDSRAAVAQAESEVLSAFVDVLPTNSFSDFSQLNLYDVDTKFSDGNAYVVALSALIYKYAITKAEDSGESVNGKLSTSLNVIADDIATDGDIDDSNLITDLKLAMYSLNPYIVTKNLKERSKYGDRAELPVANMDLYINTDGDELVNELDPDDDNDGILDVDEAGEQQYIYNETPTLQSPDLNQAFESNKEISFFWTYSQYATALEMQVSNKSDFARVDPLTDFVTTTETSTLTLESGSYFLRARTKNELGVYGPWSSIQSLKVDTFSFDLETNYDLYPDHVFASSDGGIVTVGAEDQGDSARHFIHKVDRFGKQEWMRHMALYPKAGSTLPIDGFRNIKAALLSDDGIVIAHEIEMDSNNNPRIMVSRIKSDGDIAWQHTEIASNTLFTHFVEQGDGAITLSFHQTNQYPVLLQLNTSGLVNWRYALPYPLVDISDMKMDALGNIRLLGREKANAANQALAAITITADRTGYSVEDLSALATRSESIRFSKVDDSYYTSATGFSNIALQNDAATVNWKFSYNGAYVVDWPHLLGDSIFVLTKNKLNESDNRLARLVASEYSLSYGVVSETKRKSYNTYEFRSEHACASLKHTLNVKGEYIFVCRMEDSTLKTSVSIYKLDRRGNLVPSI